MPERSASALPRATGPARWAGDGLVLEERPGLGALALRLKGEPERRLAAAALGLELAGPVGAATERAERAALRLGPDEWLLLCARAEEGALEAELHRGLGGYSAAIAPIGNGTVAIEASGPRVRTFLAKGASLDLHPRAFAPGRCAVTGFGKIRVTLWQRDGERFSLLVGRSFARSFWDWAEDVAREWAR
jgi:heterotetrameric sarcosine oxidase gamma subunit